MRDASARPAFLRDFAGRPAGKRRAKVLYAVAGPVPQGSARGQRTTHAAWRVEAEFAMPFRRKTGRSIPISKRFMAKRMGCQNH